MSNSNSTSSTVEVAVDAETAFRVFTEEVRCWWLQGPINFHDHTRTFEMRIEPGVGGRVLEVHDLQSGDGHELARLTVWEPGRRLAWKSSIDDVDTDVSFESLGESTRVTVTATIPEGGVDRGNSSWERMTVVWLPRWVERRQKSSHEPLSLARLALAVHYEDPCEAARWLRDVFGFDPSAEIPDSFDAHTWIEFHVGQSVLIVFAAEGASNGAVTHTPWIFVDDLDAQYARLQSANAQIKSEIQHHGARWFEALDLAGNPWTFAQASPTM